MHENEKPLPASEAIRISKQFDRGLPSAEVTNLAYHVIKKAATCGRESAEFPCPRTEAPYIKENLETYGYYIMCVGDDDKTPVVQVRVYWNELLFLNEKNYYVGRKPGYFTYTRSFSEKISDFMPRRAHDS